MRRTAPFALALIVALSLAGSARSQLENTKIAFSSADGGDQEIYLVNPDGTELTNLTNDPDTDLYPSWSPDGTRLAFASDRDGDWDIYIGDIVDAALVNVVNVTDTTVVNEQDPDWSPDGTQLVYRSDEVAAPSYDIYRMGLDGAEPVTPVRLTFEAHDYEPAWKPDGTLIAFGSSRTGDGDIYTMDVDGGSLTAHAPSSAGDEKPAWAPMGSLLSFGSKRVSASGDIFTIDTVGGTIEQMTFGGGSLRSAWSPDGAKITFEKTGDVVYMDAVAAAAATVVATGASAGDPAWSPLTTDPTISITAPSSADVLPYGTTETDLAVTLQNHDAPGHWHWQLDTPFAYTGAATGNEVPAGTLADTIPNLMDGQTYTVYAALVDDATGGDLLVDATTYVASRASVTFSVAPTPMVTIDAPTPGQALEAGTAEAELSVTITDHPSSGYWGWQLDSGSGPGTVNPVYVGTTATVSPLVDDGAYTVTVTLLDDADAPLSPAVTAPVSFTVGTLADAVTVVNAQGALASTVSIPIEMYDVATLDVVGVAISLTYRSDILTPTSNAGVTTAVTPGATVVPADWSLEQNVETIDATTDQLNFSMASSFSFPLIGPGTLVNIAFDVTATAPGDPLGTTYPLQLANVQLNEGAVSATPVHGSFILLELVYGDVTGNGAAGAYDAAWVLEHVANALLATDVTFPIEETAPVWASLPLPEVDADKVADVDVLDGIAAPDASLILQKEVGLIDLFPAETPAAPIADAVGLPYRLVAGAKSVRPAERLTVALDATAISELYAGELRLEFDASLLTPVEASRRSSRSRGTPSPLFVQRQGEGRVAVAFASGRPMGGSDARVDVTFEASRAISEPTESAIRATHLRLNRSLIDTGFVYQFRIEPYRNRLMANYPNPFNPETWIPFELAEAADVTIRIYDLAGSRVRTLELGALPTGEYVGRERAAYWDGQNTHGERVSSGVYVYELAAGEYRSLRRMVVMK